MKISKLMDAFPVSPIRRLSPYASQAKKNGLDVIHLNIGQPDIETPQVFQEALHHALNEVKIVAYQDSAGYLPLREQMAVYFQSLGMPYDVSDIVVTNGGSEALQIAFMTVADPGDEILVPEPYYANYLSFSTSSQTRLVPLTTTVENDFALPSFEAIEEQITAKTRAILIANPSNPTGAVLSQDEIDRVRHIALKHDLFILADELYRELTYDGIEPTSFAVFKDIEDRVVFLDSVSKRYSACGVRIGCIASKNKDVMRCALKYGQGRLAAPTFEMMAAVSLYKLGEEHFAPMRAKFEARRNALLDGLQKITGVSCSRPRGAFYTMCRLPVPDTEEFARWMLENYEQNGRTLMVAPAASFYLTPNRGLDEIRVAYVYDIPDLLDACSILEGALDRYLNR